MKRVYLLFSSEDPGAMSNISKSDGYPTSISTQEDKKNLRTAYLEVSHT
jgi:hypothetical protein